MSPDVLTPSGIMQTGFGLARIFWTASGRAGWLMSPSSAATTFFCTIVVVLAYAGAAIIYLLTLIEASVVVIGGSVLLAFASLRWTWDIFPRWGAAVLGVGVRLMFLLMVLTVGLVLAQQWSEAMAGVSGSVTTNTFLAAAAMVESLVFVALVYSIPRHMAMLVGGGSALTFGEAFLASAMAGTGRVAAQAGESAASAAGQAVSAGASAAATATSQVVQKMLLS
jgi:P-type conjugative transfer protein TrbL